MLGCVDSVQHGLGAESYTELLQKSITPYVTTQVQNGMLACGVVLIVVWSSPFPVEDYIYQLYSIRSRYRLLFPVRAQVNCEPFKICHSRSELSRYRLVTSAAETLPADARRRYLGATPNTRYAEFFHPRPSSRFHCPLFPPPFEGGGTCPPVPMVAPPMWTVE